MEVCLLSPNEYLGSESVLLWLQRKSEIPECVLSSAEMHSLCMLPCSISVVVMNRPLHKSTSMKHSS